MGYRLDIQLLRALAVILVVLYHLEIPFFNKGFLGVDIFFVISGFLMAVLYKQGQPVEFFRRRIRRLFPPYIVVLITTIILGLLILLPNEIYQLKKQALYSAFFSSNIGFWSDNSYFDSSGFKPLLHFWTLGVEAQYYLFVPLIMFFVSKNKLSIFIFAIVSFCLCTAVLYISPKTSFFMMPLRAWEFLFGAIAGIYFTNKGAVKFNSSALLGAIGFIGLVGVQFLPINGEKLNFFVGHPGLAALLTCLSTLLVIVFGVPSKFLSNKLSKFFVYIGTISYSIYLVHFPVISLYFYEPFAGTRLSNGNLLDSFKVFLIISLLSIALYYLVEKPGPKFRQSIFAGMLAVAVTVFFVGLNYIISVKYTAYELGFLLANEDRAVYRCGKEIRIKDPLARVCLLEGGYKKSVLLVGNSHADSIKNSFSKVASLYKYNTYFVVDNTPLHGGIGYEQLISEAISKGIKTIVLHHKANSVHPDTYLELYRAALDSGINLAVIGPVPIYAEHIPKYVSKNYNKNEIDIGLQSKKQHLYSVAVEHKLFESIKSNNVGGFMYYEPADYLCDEYCKYIGSDGKAWYFDRHHLTLTGAEQLEPLFEEMFIDIERNVK